MSIRVMTHVWQHSKHKGSDLLLLLAIADFASDEGIAFPSVPTLAAKTRLTVRNVQLRLRQLQKSTELTIHLNEGPGGVHLYHVLVQEVKSFQGEKDKKTALCVDGGEKFSGGVKSFQVKPTSPGGEAHFTGGVKPTSPRSIIDPSPNRQKKENPSVSTVVETSPHDVVTGRWIVQTYNTETPPDHPKHTIPLSPARLKRANDYAKRFPDPAFWHQVFAEVWRSPWMRGQRTSQGRRAIKRDLFWMLQTQQGGGQENCVKVYEGNYREDSSHVGPGSILDNPRTAQNVAGAQRSLKRMMSKYGLTEEDFDAAERGKNIPGAVDSAR